MNYQEGYNQAKKSGYSDQEIMEYLSAKDPSFGEKVVKAQEAGYTPEQVLNYLNGSSQQKQPQLKPKGLTQGAYEILRESEEEERELERHKARGTSRVIETLGGLPGDVMKLLEGITGRKAEEFPLPTSASLKEKSEKWTQGYTSPKNELEEKGDELLVDIASSMLPGGRAYSMARNIGIPLAGALVKEGIQRIKGDKESGDYGKLGTMFMLDLIANRRAMVPRKPGFKGALDMGGPQSYINGLFEEAKSSLPKGAHMVEATGLEFSLKNLKESLLEGGTRESRKQAITAIDELLGKVKDGKINIHELPAFRTRINEDIQKLGGWDFTTPPAIRKRAITNLGDVKRHVIDAGESYGRSQNPDFYKAWKSANEAQSVLSRSNVVSNFVEKTIGDKIVSKGVRSLFGLGGGAAVVNKAGLSGAITSGAGAAGAASVYGAGKLLYRVIKSPTLRQYYFNTITAALNGQKGVLIQNITALDKALQEEESD